MAEKKIGEGMVGEMIKRGAEELRTAIVQQSAPAPADFQAALDAAAARGQNRQREAIER
jgi:hypothetical protein